MPVPTDTFVDPLLTNISVKYNNEDYIAEKVFPTLSVKKKTGKYFKYDKADKRQVDSLRTGLSRANRVDHGLIQVDYGPLREHALEEPITYDERDQADSPVDVRTDATENVTDKLLIGKEVELATMLGDTAIVTQNVTLAGTDQWNDYDNSDPFADINTAISTVRGEIGQKPNTIWMGADVFERGLQNHPDLLERVKYSERGIITEELLATLFGVEKVYIGRSTYNSADEGQAAVSSDIWGRNFWVGYVTPTPRLKSITAGFHLQLTNGREIDRWDEPQVKAEFVRATDYYDQQLVASEAIYLIKTAVAA